MIEEEILNHVICALLALVAYIIGARVILVSSVGVGVSACIIAWKVLSSWIGSVF